MAFVVIENDDEHESNLFESDDLDEAKAHFKGICAACKNGTYEFYCGFDELEDGLTIAIEDTNSEETILEETFY